MFSSSLTRILKTLAGVLALTLALFFLVEGISSTLLFLGRFRDSVRRPPLERVHTRYDPLLGWVGIPNLALDDVYGPGKRLKTDSRGFRGDRDVGVHVPPGKVRVICSGDSFTLGYGVDNDNTWCRILSLLDSRLETVNMGQGGYGLDQAYLWYARDGVTLDHDVLLFAFITEDFRRMQRRDYVGFGKPVLRLQDGELVTDNVPVSREGYFFPWLTRNARMFASLSSVELVHRVLRSLSSAGGGSEVPSNPETWKVVLRVFEKLDEVNRSKGSTLVLVSLPDAADFSVDKSDHWRATLTREAAARGIPFIDLVDSIRKVPPERVPTLYHPDLHYSDSGNRWVATILHEKLLDLPPVARRLADREN